MANTKIGALKKATECERCAYAGEPHKLIRYIALAPGTFDVIESVCLCTQCRFIFIKKVLADFELSGYMDNYNSIAIEFHGLIMSKEMRKFTGWQIATPGILQRPNLDTEDADEV